MNSRRFKAVLPASQHPRPHLRFYFLRLATPFVPFAQTSAICSAQAKNSTPFGIYYYRNPRPNGRWFAINTPILGYFFFASEILICPQQKKPFAILGFLLLKKYCLTHKKPFPVFCAICAPVRLNFIRSLHDSCTFNQINLCLNPNCTKFNSLLI